MSVSQSEEESNPELKEDESAEEISEIISQTAEQNLTNHISQDLLISKKVSIKKITEQDNDQEVNEDNSEKYTSPQTKQRDLSTPNKQQKNFENSSVYKKTSMQSSLLSSITKKHYSTNSQFYNQVLLKIKLSKTGLFSSIKLKDGQQAITSTDQSLNTRMSELKKIKTSQILQQQEQLKSKLNQEIKLLEANLIRQQETFKEVSQKVSKQLEQNITLKHSLTEQLYDANKMAKVQECEFEQQRWSSKQVIKNHLIELQSVTRQATLLGFIRNTTRGSGNYKTVN